MTTSELLVLAASFGTGHLQAARAVAAAYEQLEPGAGARAITVESRLMGSVSAGYMTLIEQAPFAYRSLYQAHVGNTVRRLVRLLMSPAVRKELKRVTPAGIVATHPFPAAVAGALRRRGLLDVPVGVALTDFAPHPLWISEGADRYFVASDQAAKRLQHLGVRRAAIVVSGIPVHPDFTAQPRRETPPGSRRRVLVMGGGLGLGPVAQSVRALAGQPQADLAVTVVCGRNERLQQQLRGLVGADPRFVVLGYTKAIPLLMANADLLVTKPGGLSCSEALACGLPMLLLRPLPGHEEENAAHLTMTGAGRIVDEALVGRTVEDLLFGDGAELGRMRECSDRVGRPDAAAVIAREMLSLTTASQTAIA